MSLDRNRLNFPNMVDRHLKLTGAESINNNLSFFDAQTLTANSLLEVKHHYLPKPTDIATSLNSIVQSVHHSLKEARKRSPPLKKVRHNKTEIKSVPESLIATYARSIENDSTKTNRSRSTNNYNSINANKTQRTPSQPPLTQLHPQQLLPSQLALPQLPTSQLPPPQLTPPQLTLPQLPSPQLPPPQHSPPQLQQFTSSQLTTEQLSWTAPAEVEECFVNLNEIVSDDNLMSNCPDDNNKSINPKTGNKRKNINRRTNSPTKSLQKQFLEKTLSKEEINAHLDLKKKISVNLQKMYGKNDYPKSIAQLKANLERKHQQQLFYSSGKSLGGASFDNHRRLRTILQQKRLLEEILIEHEKIQRDRRNISMEIEVMKQYLSDIRNKLDTSLRKLGVKKLISEKYPAPKKRMIPITSNLSTFSAADENNIATNTNARIKNTNMKMTEQQSKGARCKSPS